MTLGADIGLRLERAFGKASGALLFDILSAIQVSDSGVTIEGVSIDSGLIGNALSFDPDNNGVILRDDFHIATGEENGGSFGRAPEQKIGFHGAAPSVQRAGEDQEALTPTTDITGEDTVSAAAVLTAIQALETLVNELRAALVEKGLILGEAAE